MIKFIDKYKNIYNFSKARNSSYPFISGDTFRSIAKIKIDSINSLLDISELNYISNEIFFFEIGFLNNLYNLDLTVDILKKIEINSSVAILHNGDILPDCSFFTFLKSKFKKIYSVNINFEDNQIKAIPIGLENLHYWNNGVISNFSTQNHNSIRDIDIYTSFRVNTNFEVRNYIKEICKASRHIDYGEKNSVQNNVKNLRRSLFVISPEGNGLDCHRTWEAIYCGAVPVVRRGIFPESLIRALPILEISDWEIFYNLEKKDLINLFDNIKLKPDKVAFFPYWNYKIIQDIIKC